MANRSQFDVARLNLCRCGGPCRTLRRTFIDAKSGAQRAADANCHTPLLIVADGQTAGRGRQGNSWWTGDGSLAFSLLFDPETFSCPRRPEPRVALVVGVAIIDAIGPRIPAARVGLHWPNDVFVGEKKLAGILVEVLSDGRHIWALE